MKTSMLQMTRTGKQKEQETDVEPSKSIRFKSDFIILLT